MWSVRNWFSESVALLLWRILSLRLEGDGNKNSYIGRSPSLESVFTPTCQLLIWRAPDVLAWLDPWSFFPCFCFLLRFLTTFYLFGLIDLRYSLWPVWAFKFARSLSTLLKLAFDSVANFFKLKTDDRINATLWSVFINWWRQRKEEEGLIRIATRPKPNSTIDLFLFESQNVNTRYLKLLRCHFSLEVFSFEVLGNPSREYESSKLTFVTGLAGRKAQLLEWWCPSLLLWLQSFSREIWRTPVNLSLRHCQLL